MERGRVETCFQEDERNKSRTEINIIVAYSEVTLSAPEVSERSGLSPSNDNVRCCLQRVNDCPLALKSDISGLRSCIKDLINNFVLLTRHLDIRCNENQLHTLLSIYLQFILSLYRYMFRACILPIIRRYSLYMYSNWYVVAGQVRMELFHPDPASSQST
jgi:hypothetical protein